MPIKVPNNLPAVDTLTKENVFVMTDHRAMTQDIRPLQILILNLMPTKIDTETQFTRLLGNTPLQVELELLQTSTHKSHVTAEEHMIAFYKTFNQVKNKFYDGMIITGAPIELMEFEEVDYWDELCEIMEWSKSHVHSTLHVCWGAQAALYYHYGINKKRLPAKLFGVFRHTLEYKTGMLFRGFDDEFYVPHSRNTTIDPEDIKACKDLKIISMSDEAGVFAVKSNNDRQIFIMGHSEYDADTLLKEYTRDHNAGVDTAIPCNYFPEDDPSKPPIVRWRSCANLFYSNWLNYFVYQSTPYDIETIHEEPADKMIGEVETVVAKFGGSSLADAGQFRKVKAIIESSESRNYVVVSAPGKRNPSDDKITDLLIEAAEVYGKDPSAAAVLLEKVRARYEEIAAELGTSFDGEGEFAKIADDIKNLSDERRENYLASRGEYLAAKIMADFISYEFVDAAECVRFDENGKFDDYTTQVLLKKRLAESPKCVIPGFYGSLPTGEVETFTRGGSDISGAIVAAATQADLYENWTDVSGFLLADPRIVANPVPVGVITYKELRELAYLGAAVMHPDAVFPVIKRDIPIQIKNTNAPEDAGTLIVKSARYYNSKIGISGISGKTGFTSIVLTKPQLSDDIELREKILAVFADMGVTIRNVTTGIDTLTLIELTEEVDKISMEELKARIVEVAGDVGIQRTDDLAQIGIVGRELSSSPEVAIKILSALAARKINIKMIDHSTGSINMIIAVEAKDYQTSVAAIYDEFARA